ncbi:MAG: hypothetical protein AAFR58_20130 [Cyanobacteria bacterium J06627_28]
MMKSHTLTNRLWSKYFWWVLMWLAAALSVEFSLYRLVGSLSEDIPRLYGSYALRSLFFILSSLLAVGVFHTKAVKKQRQEGTLFARNALRSKRQSLLAASIVFLNLLFVGLLFWIPSLFSALALEGSLVETLSAIFFFVGSAVFGTKFYGILRQRFPNKFLVMLGLGFLTIIFFVIAMEEVSWFQRILAFDTPETFSKNLQGEFNIHNFATKMFENAFYTGAFVCLIGLPFLYSVSAIPGKLKGLEVFLGSRFTLCVSSLFVAYNYHYWNSFSTQLPYFLTLIMLASLFRLSSTKGNKRVYITFLCLLLVTQLSFFLQGHTMNRLWDATEYKEFFIALGFLLYSFDVRRNLLQYVSRYSNALVP